MHGYVIALLILIGGYSVFVWWSIRTAITKSVQIEAHTVSYKRHSPTPTVRFLVAGDSTAVGIGALTSEESVAGRLGADFPAADIANVGVNGLRLAGLKKKLEEMRGDTYDLLILQIGANDVTGRTSYEEIRTVLGEVLELAEGLGKQTIILTSGDIGLAAPFKWPLSWYMSARTRTVRGIFIEEVLKHPTVTYVDLFKEKEEDPFSRDINRYYSPDYFHPSGEGYGLWYEAIKKFITVRSGSL